MEQTIRSTWRRTACVLVAAVSLAGCSAGGSDDQVGAARDASSEETLVRATAEPADAGPATVLRAPVAAASVTVPDGALGAVDPATLTAEVVVLDRPAADGHAVTFVLGPDGATFAEPVLLQWDGPWSDEAVLSLGAWKGDGTPIPDAGSTTANSVQALRVEPTSATTARYTLPVDHFSVWSIVVFAKPGGSHLFVHADLPDELPASSTQLVPVDWMIVGHALQCGVLQVTSSSDVISASDVLGEDLQCALGSAPGAAFVLSCDRVGSAEVEVTLFAIEVDAFRFGAADVFGALRRQMFLSMFDLTMPAGVRGEGYVARFDDASTRLHGALYAARTRATVRCLGDVAPAPFPSEGSVSPGATGATGPAPVAPATTAPSGSALPPATGPGTPTTPWAAPTTNPRPTPMQPTPPPTPLVPTPLLPTPSTTTPTPSTTTPSEPVPPPPPTFPPDAPWGVAGTWAFNETGTCDYNGSGGCGWYYGTTRGEYVLGPLGGPGDSIPV